jgi:hypothetical protein
MVYDLEFTRSFPGNGPKTHCHSALMNYGKPSGEQVLVQKCVVIGHRYHGSWNENRPHEGIQKLFQHYETLHYGQGYGADTITKHRVEAFWRLLGPFGLTAAGVETTWTVKGSVA